jgi:hypothetical protein
MHLGRKCSGDGKMMKTKQGTFDSERGRKYCRACNSIEILQVLDLGDLPIANELPKSSDEIVELFPLRFGVCKNCGLGQVGEPVSRERLFSDYRYLSSVSETWLTHAQNYANSTVEALKLTSRDRVVEVASNDGYLLQYFKELGINVLGVEPAQNIALLANFNGIETINEFFGVRTAEKIRAYAGEPRLIVANNVAAHVPDIRDFFGGFDTLAGDQTLISIENPSILNLLRENQFDTIYHEHYSYLSAFSLKSLGKEFSINLFKVESISTHGGSNRYWFKRGEPTESERIEVDNFIDSELEAGLLNDLAWSNFSTNVARSLEDLKVWLLECKIGGRRVYGFTAAAKASTILNAGRISGEEISGIAESSPEKLGRFLPALGIPIISKENLLSLNPTDILIFSWNISGEISNLVWSEHSESVRCWVAIPNLKEIHRDK